MLRLYVKAPKALLSRYASVAVNQTNPKQKNESPPLWISCKRTEFNARQCDFSNKIFGSIPLASKGWMHKKSKGDHFKINPIKSSSDYQQNAAIKEFNELNLLPFLIGNLKKEEITKATQIQIDAISNILRGEHTLIAAETGCGKTLAYLLPILQKLIEKKQIVTRSFNTPLGLILTPGRELALQIAKVAEKLTAGADSKFEVKVVTGGRTKKLMTNPTFEDVDLLVGSVGAISKLTTTGIYRMHQVRHVVLDEADTLLDDSFHEKLAHFLKKFPFHKNHLQDIGDETVGTQLTLASATMPINIEELIGNLIETKTLTEVVSPDLHKIITHVPQLFQRMNKSDRPINLLSFIKKYKHRQIIVFANKSSTSDFVSLFLNDRGIKALNLNGDMPMKVREGRFEQFQNGEVDVLATTDIGSRGLDTKDIRIVINYDFPLHSADYIHRCGRVGRLGSPEDCKVINFVSSAREMDLVQKIEHAARTNLLLPDVNANITNLIRRKFEIE